MSRHRSSHPSPQALSTLETMEQCNSRLESDNPDTSIIEGSVRLLLEVLSEDGIAISKICTVDKEHILEAQKLIRDANGEALEAQNCVVKQASQKLYTYPPRPGQLEALRHLHYVKKDLILIAKTSFGKSMILQAAPLLAARSTALVILPLDQIGKEQAEYITKIGGKPCFLNSANFKNELLEEVRAGTFTHIIFY